MNNSEPEATASILAELLLYHASLGRGYISPFPVTNGLVFTSALPVDSLPILLAAEAQFHRWHEDTVADDKKQLEILENTPKESLAVMGGPEMLQKLKDSVSKLPSVTWKEEGTTKATIVELLKKSYYGALTCVDQVGGRLALALLNAMRLAGDLTLVTLTEGTSDEAFIRANATGGACIHTLTGRGSIFNFFSNCKERQVEHLIDRVKNSASGAHGIGITIAIPGRSKGFARVTVQTLEKLMINVYARGSQDPDKRVKVKFKRGTEAAWSEFLSWKLPDIIGVEEPTDWQLDLALKSPASVRNSVLFGARAAMTNAFLEAAESASGAGVFNEIELDDGHLAAAKVFATHIYVKASGHESYSRRVDNLKPNNYNKITPHKLAIAKQALIEAIHQSPEGKISRRSVRHIEGLTFGLLDRLVQEEDVGELRGVAECKMGKTTRAYVLAQDAPPMDVIDSLDEFHEAEKNFQEDPYGYDDLEALKAYEAIQHKAESSNRHIYMPVVPMSKLSKKEIRILPKLLDAYPKSLLLRGVDREPEPEKLLEGDDLDTNGMNLWVRYRPGSSEDFYDWQSAGKLKLAEHWVDEIEEEEIPSVVPA